MSRSESLEVSTEEQEVNLTALRLLKLGDRIVDRCKTTVAASLDGYLLCQDGWNQGGG